VLPTREVAALAWRDHGLSGWPATNRKPSNSAIDTLRTPGASRPQPRLLPRASVKLRLALYRRGDHRGVRQDKTIGTNHSSTSRARVTPAAFGWGNS
jgi:hypothetical protein